MINGGWPLMAATLVLALLVGLISGKILIPILHRLKFGQSIREEGPASHQVKSGTPTMGGIMILAGLFIAVIVCGRLNLDVWLAFLATLAFGFIGFLDDYLKVVKKQNLGLRAKQKLLLQIIMSVLFTLLYVHVRGGETSLHIPFMAYSLPLGWLYWPFVVFWFTGFSNAVNLTDGLDGLATSVTIIVTLAFGVIAVMTGNAGVAVFCMALIGACLAFLWYNHYPAKVFMGDTGSLALGGAVTAMAILTHTELILLIIGGIYVIETASVILQVVSFKTRGKRIFLMSPIHHHFELKGYKETQIVCAFSLVTVILSVIGILGILC